MVQPTGGRGRGATALGAVLLLAALSACAGPKSPGTVQATTSDGGWRRPASYDPPGPPQDPWGPWIRDASRRFDVPERWIREVMRQESGGRAGATSPVGAMGLMQVMPGTYRELRSRYGLGDDPYHPYDSIMAGTAYVREMYDLYGSPGFLAAYNGGPRRLEDYLWNSRSMPNETRNYVARIGPRIIDVHPRRRAAPEVYAAAEIPLNVPPGPRRMDGATMLALREQRQATDPGIQVARLPAGPVVRMEPIPDGSTSYQVASLGLAAPVGGVMRMEPIPDGSTPEGAIRVAESAAREAAALEPPAVAVAPLSVAVAPASLPGPSLAPPAGASFEPLSAPSPAAPSPAATPAAAYRVAAPPPAVAAAPRFAGSPFARPAAAQPLPPSRPAPPTLRPTTAGPFFLAAGAGPVQGGRAGFGLVGTAHAATPASASANHRAAPGFAQGFSPGLWAIQVGAFGSPNLARSAADQARGSAGALGSRAEVRPLAQGRATLYRARVTGLSRDAAQSLCDRLRARGGCLLLSPDAQG